MPLEALPPCYLLLPLPTCEPNDKLTTVWLQMRQDMNDDETRTPAYCEDIYILPELAPRCWTCVTFMWNPKTFFQRSVYFFLYMTYKGGCGWIGHETTRNWIKKHVFTLSLFTHGRQAQPLSNCVYISTHLNPKLKPTTTSTKACATYESVKIATLEDRK